MVLDMLQTTAGAFDVRQGRCHRACRPLQEPVVCAAFFAVFRWLTRKWSLQKWAESPPFDRELSTSWQ